MSVTRLEINHRAPFEFGRSFGDVGSYTYLEGKAYFEVDPSHEANNGITDLALAPVNSGGKVEFSADFSMLKPTDPKAGRRTMLLDVVNRGNRTVVTRFNDVERANHLATSFSSGNGFLMREGYTVVFCGWQADVPPIPGLIGLQAPSALESGEPLVGRVLNQYQANEDRNIFPLADRYHLVNPSVYENTENAKLLVGDHPNGAFEEVPSDKWSIIRVEDREIEPDPAHLYMKDGFELGRIYQLVYTARGSRVVGLGFAAMRDISSFMKYGTASEGNPSAGELDVAISYGVSQTGRFLRQYLHTGMNTDENGNMAMDGVIAHVGGGMRGEFNLRFGQPSKDVCFIMPELFPFTDLPQRDPETGKHEGLLDLAERQESVPKIMFTNSSAEYWRGDAGLIHTDLEGPKDAPEHPNVRRYHFAGTQHGHGTYPPVVKRESDLIKGHLPFNAVDYSPILKACLNNIDEWIKTGEAPPESRHPRHSDGTAVESHTLLGRFDNVPGVRVPDKALNPMRLDYGNEQHLGRTIKLPAERMAQYPAFVSDVDETFNEVAGVRLPDVAVPVTTNTGWNPRDASVGNEELLIGITGGLAGWTIPLPTTKEQGDISGDPRPSIEKLYESRDEYISKVRDLVSELVSERYILEEDVQEIIEKAIFRYDDIVGS